MESGAIIDKSQIKRMLDRGRFSEVVKICSDILEYTPDNADILYTIASAYFAINKNKDAQKYVQRAIALNGKKVEYLILLSNCYIKDEKTSEALKLLLKNVKHHKKSELIYVQISNIYLQQSKFWRAEYYCRKALSFERHNALIYNILGQIYYHKRKYDKALRNLERALRIDKNLPEANRLLGIINHINGQYGDAIPYLEQSLTHNQNDANVLFALGMCYLSTGRLDDAALMLNKNICLQPHNPSANYYLGEAMRKMGRTSEAQEHYNQSICLNNNYILPYIASALLYVETEEINSAYNVINELTSVIKDRDYTILPQARIHEYNGELEHAKDLLYKALDKKTYGRSKATILHNIATLLEKQHRYDDAYDYYSESKLEFSKQNGNFLNSDNLVNKISYYHGCLNNISEDMLSECSSGYEPIFLLEFPCSGVDLITKAYTQHPKVHNAGYSVVDDIYNNLNAILGFSSGEHIDIATLSERQLQKIRRYYHSREEDYLTADNYNKKTIYSNALNIIHLPLIKIIFPNAKFISIIRDPRDVCIDCFTRETLNYNFMSHFITIDQTISVYNQIMHLYLSYKKNFSNDIIELKYEDIIDNIDYYLEYLYKVADLQYSESELNEYRNSCRNIIKNPYNISVNHGSEISSVGRWRHYGMQFIKIFNQFSFWINEFGYKVRT